MAYQFWCVLKQTNTNDALTFVCQTVLPTVPERESVSYDQQ